MCLLCHQSTLRNIDLCLACENSLPPHSSPSFITPFDYQFPISHMITQLKFEGKLIYAKLLGQLLAKKILLHYQSRSLPHLIIPVPLHKKRLQERGFNQALEVAKTVSKILNIPINATNCIRKKHTAAQSSLNAASRKENIKHSFELIRPLTSSHIAILDDVITTGETVSELANTILKSSTAIIDFWCCAHTSIC